MAGETVPSISLLLRVHLYDPHVPYEPLVPFKNEYSKELYDGEIAYVDRELERLFNGKMLPPNKPLSLRCQIMEKACPSMGKTRMVYFSMTRHCGFRGSCPAQTHRQGSTSRNR